jgi:hypothetical protein
MPPSPAVVAPLRSPALPCLPDFSPEIVHCRCAFSSQFVVPRRRRPSVWRLGAAGKSPSAVGFPAWAGGGNHLHLCCPLYCYLIGVGWSGDPSRTWTGSFVLLVRDPSLLGCFSWVPCFDREDEDIES